MHRRQDWSSRLRTACARTMPARPQRRRARRPSPRRGRHFSSWFGPHGAGCGGGRGGGPRELSSGPLLCGSGCGWLSSSFLPKRPRWECEDVQAASVGPGGGLPLRQEACGDRWVRQAGRAAAAGALLAYGREQARAPSLCLPWAGQGRRLSVRRGLEACGGHEAAGGGVRRAARPRCSREARSRGERPEPGGQGHRAADGPAWQWEPRTR